MKVSINPLHDCILICMEKTGADRTVYATYHLLKGKKSSQTMQDIKLYKLSEYFRIFPHITREEYDEHLRYLERNHYVTITGAKNAIITEMGRQYLQKKEKITFNGLLYSEQALRFWRRFVLITQTMSHLQKKENKFQPIIQDTDVTKWVKQFFLSASYEKEMLIQHAYEECRHYLQTRTEQEATIFVWKLTGYKRIGLTDNQIAYRLGVDKYTVFLLFQSTLHGLMEHIDRYPLLRQISPSRELHFLNDSTKKTYQLLQQGFTIEKISQIRRLKQNTIEDHIVEMIFNDLPISIDNFVSSQQQANIKRVYKALKTRKLRDLKQRLGEAYTYFQIRLVLAKVESKNDN